MAEKMPVEQVADLVFGQWMARVVYVIARLGIADHVAPASQSATELAAATQTHAPSLYRVLRAATTIGVLTEDAEGRFALTEMGDCLRSDHPAGLRWMSMLLNDEWEWKTWEYLPWSVETGQSAFEHIYGMNRFEYLQRHPESRVLFDRAMTGYSALHNTAVVASYPFATRTHVIDLGGGNGGLLTAILQAHPALTGTLVELEPAIAQARPLVAAAGVADRCTLTVGDFFQTVPSADTYLIQRCFHNWNDAAVLQVLTTVRHNMPPSATLLVIELVVPPAGEPAFGKILDVDMLVTTHGGRERTETEWRHLLNTTGFQVQRLIAVPGTPLTILECIGVE
ncbi:MAG: methyltransferase [Chloroflexaceae bacterium]